MGSFVVRLAKLEDYYDPYNCDAAFTHRGYSLMSAFHPLRTLTVSETRPLIPQRNALDLPPSGSPPELNENVYRFGNIMAHILSVKRRTRF